MIAKSQTKKKLRKKKRKEFNPAGDVLVVKEKLFIRAVRKGWNPEGLKTPSSRCSHRSSHPHPDFQAVHWSTRAKE